MYVMHRRERVVRLPDGGTRTEPGETRTFRSVTYPSGDVCF